MQTQCANTQYLNAYLAGLGADSARADWEADRAAAILKEMQPFGAEEVMEALTELDKDGEKVLAAALATGDNATAGAALNAAVLAYWKRYATNKAADDYASLGCYHCLDKGCLKCDGDYAYDARRDAAMEARA